MILLTAVLSICAVRCAVIDVRYKPREDIEVETLAPSTPIVQTTKEPDLIPTGLPPTSEEHSFCKMEKRDFVFTTPECRSNVTERIKVCVGLQSTFQIVWTNDNGRMVSHMVVHKCIPVTEERIKHRKLHFTNCRGRQSKKIIKPYFDVVTGCRDVVEYVAVPLQER